MGLIQDLKSLEKAVKKLQVLAESDPLHLFCINRFGNCTSDYCDCYDKERIRQEEQAYDCGEEDLGIYEDIPGIKRNDEGDLVKEGD